MRNNTPLEHAEQTMFFQMVRARYPQFFTTDIDAEMKAFYSGALIFAIPNGGARNGATGSMLKAEGVQRGVPDIFCAIPSGGYHGLFIEMKRRSGGRLDGCQVQMREMLTEQGYKAVVCHGCDEAFETLEKYLALDKQKGAK